MKYGILVFFIVSSFAFSKEKITHKRSISSSKDAVVCNLNANNQIIDFNKSKESISAEYKTYEKGEFSDIQFYLMGGHGVFILEAQRNNKMIASTFYSLNDPIGSDKLRLKVRSETKKVFVEAFCEGIDEKLKAVK